MTRAPPQSLAGGSQAAGHREQHLLLLLQMGLQIHSELCQQLSCLKQIGMGLGMHPVHLGRQLAETRQLLPEIAVMGGISVINQLDMGEGDPVFGWRLGNRNAVQLGRG